MKQYINSIRKSIENENWFASLFMALAIPGICGRIEDIRNVNSLKNNYIKWFRKHLGIEYKGRLNAEFFWELYRSLLEPYKSIDDKINAQFLPVTYHDSPLHNSDITINEGESYAHLRVDVFCDDICLALEKWLRDTKDNRDIQSRINSLFSLQSYTGDPRMKEIVLGNINLSWGKHCIKNLYVDLPKGIDNRPNKK